MSQDIFETCFITLVQVNDSFYVPILMGYNPDKHPRTSLSCACCLNVPNQTVDMSSQHTEFQCSFLAKLLGRISSFYNENYKDVINVNYFSFLLVRKG